MLYCSVTKEKGKNKALFKENTFLDYFPRASISVQFGRVTDLHSHSWWVTRLFREFRSAIVTSLENSRAINEKQFCRTNPQNSVDN